MQYNNSKQRQRIDQESKILTQLDHPNIVAYEDVEWDDDENDVRLYMELCEGRDLQKYIDDLKK